jgi:hypothetical protein
MDYRTVDHFVGLEISRDWIKKWIFITALQYIEKKLSKFNLSTRHPFALPVDKR